MDKGEYKKLNKYHVIFLINGSMSGLGILTLPKDLASVGYNQWMVPILLGIVVNLALIPIVYLGLQYPKDSLYTIHEKLLGTIIGKIFNVAVVFYGLISVSGVSQGYLVLIQTTILPERKITGPLILLLLLSVYVVAGGIKSVARVAIMGFFMTAWTIYFSQWPIANGDVRNLLPLFNFTSKDLLYAFHRGYYAMLGYEMMLFYFPYILDQKKALKHATIGIWITIFYYFFVCISSIVYLSPWQLAHSRFPVLNLLRSIRLSFMERVENVFVALWIFLILSTVSTILWVTKKGVDSLLKKKQIWHLYLIALVAFFMIQGPIPHEIEKFLYHKFVIYWGYFFNVWPLLLLIIHKIKKKKEVTA